MATDAQQQNQPNGFPRFIGNYELGALLGSGVSGSTFRATHVHTGAVVAVKLQAVAISYRTNGHERAVYPLLQGGVGMPRLWAHGVLGAWDYLAMDLLGASLHSMHRQTVAAAFDLRTGLAVAVQLISRLEFMHSRGVLHRDVQLGNTALGLAPNARTLYMLDFGFSTLYVNPKTGRHIKPKRERDFIGNYWFSSVNVHCRAKTASRRDDLEALALMLIHIVTPGGLPWTRNGVPRNDTEHAHLKRLKRDARPEELCAGLPPTFAAFLHYCRGLGFAAPPDYARWRDAFRACGREYALGDVEEFVWPPHPMPEEALRRIKRLKAPPQAAKGAEQHDGQRRPDPSVEAMLKGLAQMAIAFREDQKAPPPPLPAPTRPVLGDRDLNVQPARAPAEEPRKPKLLPPPPPPRGVVISISSSSNSSDDFCACSDCVSERQAQPAWIAAAAPAVVASAATPAIVAAAPAPAAALAPTTRYAKASRLLQLARDAARAPDHAALAALVREFAAVVGAGTSRTLTREGFVFLDALHRQLVGGQGGAVVRITAPRRPTGSGRSAQSSQQQQQHMGADPMAADVTVEERRSRLWHLRCGVVHAADTAALGGLVREFGAVAGAAAGRKLTKDGLVFLDGVAARLLAIRPAC